MPAPIHWATGSGVHAVGGARRIVSALDPGVDIFAIYCRRDGNVDLAHNARRTRLEGTPHAFLSTLGAIGLESPHNCAVGICAHARGCSLGRAGIAAAAVHARINDYRLDGVICGANRMGRAAYSGARMKSISQRNSDPRLTRSIS